MNIIEGLQTEVARVNKIIGQYRDPILKGAGEFSAQMMEADVKKAERAISTGDTIQMICMYKKLQGWQDS